MYSRRGTMVKVIFESWKKIIIHEAIRYSLDDLLAMRVMGLREGTTAPPLLWAQEVIFDRVVMPPTEDVIREQLLGKIHYSSIEWAAMAEFVNFKKVKGVEIPIINVSLNPTLREVAKALKERRRLDTKAIIKDIKTKQ